MLVFGMEESPVLVEELKERFFDLIYAMDYNPRATRILQKIQEYVSKPKIIWKYKWLDVSPLFFITFPLSDWYQ